MSQHRYELSGGVERWFYTFIPHGTNAQVKQRGFIDEEAALRAELAARRRFAKITPAAGGTVAAELIAWVESRKNALAPTSYVDYTYRFSAYVIPHIGHLPLHRAATPLVISKLYTKLREKGGRNGRPLSDTTVKAVHLSLMAAFRSLKIDVEGIEAPRVAESKRHRRGGASRKRGRHGVWTLEQAVEFLRSIRSERLFGLYALAIIAGMRRGELCGLRWRDVDLEKGVINIVRQRLTAGRVTYEDEPKCGSLREIPIGPLVVEILRNQWIQCEETRMRCGPDYVGEDHVFITGPASRGRGKGRGRPYSPVQISHHFKVLAIRSGLPVIALHDLRHTCASIAPTLGVDIKSLQARLGHSEAATLTDVYMHQLPAAAWKASTTLEGALLPTT